MLSVYHTLVFLVKKPPLDFLLSAALFLTPRCFMYKTTALKMVWLVEKQETCVNNNI